MKFEDKIVLVDMDGVLVDFEEGFSRAWKKRYPERFHAEPHHREKVFDIELCYPQEFHQDVWEIIEEDGHFYDLPAIPGGLEAIEEMLTLGIDVRICTAPLEHWYNVVPEKYAWVERHFGHKWTSRMILTKDKTIVRGDILIDDKPEITGAMVPEWKQILFDQPYNKALHLPRITTWDDWRRVVEEVLESTGREATWMSYT